MANQPTKYSKFLVGAASAALVAAAVAPVASAADFNDTKGNTHEEAINALADAGVISGYPDGSFQPNKTLTRSDVVKLLGKWLVSEGAEIPADAVSNPRFTDLTSSSNKELLEYAAVVKDNGVFIGSNGRLLAADNISRENMAVVIVRAFDNVKGIDLVTYVNGQDFKADVTDLKTAKSEAQGAINVLDFFDITNPTVANFNPKGSTTRGHFATFLYKSINTDFSAVTGAVTADGAVKAINATTVEVTFKEAVENISGFTIEGLTVSNAAVKQSDNKVVVLTTAVQEGGKKYVVSHAGKEIGSFEGISSVIPTKIDITTASVQGKVGAQATVSADVGVKQAGIPVTFNVKADTLVTLNKDQIFEAVTNAEGIATFSYTQYAAGNDEVVAYPTGAPAVRSLGYVFWGVDTILSVKAQDEKGNAVNNGEDKTYKLTYLDPKTGKPVANKKFNVTFAENIDVNVNQVSKATVNGVNPTQLLNDTTPEVATVTTDAKGEAVFTVSGHNTAVTPVVFESLTNNTLEQVTYKVNKLQASVEKVTFGALQASYVIDVTREGGEEAATGPKNGREYKVVVKTKDGKVAANELVNVAFNEDIDRVISTSTKAYFIQDDKQVNDYITVKTDSKGEAKFTIATDLGNDKDYATPIVWIDINSSNAKEGKFDEGEPNKIAPITYFAKEKLTDGTVKAYNDAKDADKAIDKFEGSETASFKFTAANQSGKKMSLPEGYDRIEATFTVFNTGDNEITVNGQTVSPNRSYTTPTVKGAVPTIYVKPDGDKTTSVRVVANGTAYPTSSTSDLRPINLGSHEAKVEFTSTTEVPSNYTGAIQAINTADKELTFVGKKAVSIKDAKFFGSNGANIANFDAFLVELRAAGTDGVIATYLKDSEGKVTIKIVRTDANVPAIKFDEKKSALSTAVITKAEVSTTTATAATATVAFADIDAAGNSITVNGVEYKFNAGATTTDKFYYKDAADLEAKVTGDVKATVNGANIVLTGKADGSGFKYVVNGTEKEQAADTGVVKGGQEVTLTFSSAINAKVGDIVDINGLPATVAKVESNTKVVIELTIGNQIASGAAVTALTVDGGSNVIDVTTDVVTVVLGL